MPLTSAPARVVNGPFMLGLIAVPIVFVWFLLLPGYPLSLRKAAFCYAFAIPVLNAIAAAGEALMR